MSYVILVPFSYPLSYSGRFFSHADVGRSPPVGTRKLACTKEPDGCSRCKREGIACHYSPQKPMGRPRKRPRDQTSETPTDGAATAAAIATATATATATTTTETTTETVNPSEERAAKNVMTEIPPTTTDPGLDFLDWLAEDLSHGNQGDPTSMLPPQEQSCGFKFWYDGNTLGEIDFDMPLPSDATPSFSAANIDPALFMPQPSAPPAETSVPGLSPASASGTPDDSSTSSATPAQTTFKSNKDGSPCACTANLYLALDSMQKLSPDVMDGIRQARSAAKTAYQVVNCSSCSIQQFDHPPRPVPGSDPVSAIPNYDDHRPTIYNFQNMMLLGTLIPSIVHAYEKILVAVDRETALAQRERRQLVFRLNGLGGIWGPVLAPHTREATDSEHEQEIRDACGAAEAFEHRVMEPAMWRLAVRSLLKLDVYGLYQGGCVKSSASSRKAAAAAAARVRGDTRAHEHHHHPGMEWGGRDTGPGSVGDPLHLGLKDIVTMMDNRSRARHAFMDAMVSTGAWPELPCSSKLNVPGEAPTCQQIISIAKRAIDGLIIP